MDVKALPKSVRNFMKKEIPMRLSKDPIANSLPLNPPLEKFRSCHIGEHRVVFHVAADVRAIGIVGIGNSTSAEADVYKKLEKLAQQGALAQQLLAALRGF